MCLSVSKRKVQIYIAFSFLVQVPARCEAFMCFGPLVPDGYGCCYNPRGDAIYFGISAFNSSPETDSATFRNALEQSLMDMHDVALKEGLKAKL